jgi:RNA polymerase primary sigma factor
MNDSIDTRDLVDSYLADISFSKPLPREREVELAARIQEEDTQARDELVQANLLFVVSVTRHYQNCGLPLSDLIGVECPRMYYTDLDSSS